MHWGPWPAGPVRPSRPCCLGEGSAPCPGDYSYIRSLWKLSSMMQKTPRTTGVGGRGRSPLIRAPAPGPWHCRRPSVVTEGYIRLPPLPPTTSCQFRLTPGSRPVHDYTCNLQCILRVVFKKHRFLQGFVAFAVSRFHLGDVKKPWVFHGFGS